MTTLILSCLIWVSAGFINGVTSFGGNIVAIPLLSTLIDPHEVVIIGCMSSIGICATTILIYRNSAPVKEVMLACVGCALGIPLGLPISLYVSKNLLLMIIAIIIISFLAWQYISPKISNLDFSFPKWCIIPFSIIFGCLYTITGMPGPIMAIYLIMNKWQKEEILVMMNAIGIIGGTLTSVQYFLNGSFTKFIFLESLLGIMFASIGVVISIFFVKRINSKMFRKGVIWMLAFSATVIIFRVAVL